MATRRTRRRTTKRYKPRGRVGAGTRFKQLTAALKKRGARSPKALAAWIGRKKYGKRRFQQMAAAGRRRRRRRR